MKNLIVTCLFLFSASLYAHTVVIDKEPAVQASGKHYVTGENVTECSFSMVENWYDEGVYRLYFNSDEQARVNFAFSVPMSLVPLEEGTRYKLVEGYSVEYRDGVLSAHRRVCEDLFCEYREMTVRISPDLNQVSEFTAIEEERRRFSFRKHKYKELSCSF